MPHWKSSCAVSSKKKIFLDGIVIPTTQSTQQTLGTISNSRNEMNLNEGIDVKCAAARLIAQLELRQITSTFLQYF